VQGLIKDRRYNTEINSKIKITYSRGVAKVPVNKLGNWLVYCVVCCSCVNTILSVINESKIFISTTTVTTQ